jgi:hypothetical protein
VNEKERKKHTIATPTALMAALEHAIGRPDMDPLESNKKHRFKGFRSSVAARRVVVISSIKVSFESVPPCKYSLWHGVIEMRLAVSGSAWASTTTTLDACWALDFPFPISEEEEEKLPQAANSNSRTPKAGIFIKRLCQVNLGLEQANFTNF